MSGLIGFGSALVDELVRIDESVLSDIPGNKGGTRILSSDELPAVEARIAGCHRQRCAGGAAANTIKLFARLGGSAAFVGKIGDDECGAVFCESMAKAGVNVDGVRRMPGMVTGRCTSLITPDAERTMLTFFGAADFISDESFTPELASRYSHVYIEGYQLYHREPMERLVDKAATYGVKVCYNLASMELAAAHAPYLHDFLRRHADILFANADEARALCGEPLPGRAAEILTDLCPLVIVTDNLRGSYISRRGEPVLHVSAQVADAVDTTGAGDSWAAGFLFGYLSGWSLESSGRLGAAVSSRIVQVMGTELSEDSWSELRK